MEEEEDDFYAQNGDAHVKSEEAGVKTEHSNQDAVMQDEHANVSDNDEGDNDDEDEGGDDDEDDDDSDIDIITERQDGAVPEPPPQARPFRGIKPELPRTVSVDASAATPRPQQQSTATAQKSETTSQAKKLTVSLKDGSKYPEVRSSSIDVKAIPTWSPTGKPITEVDIDADLAEHTKPWRLPGTDQTDYFNYGFDEFTWTQYCLRQQNMSSAINAQKQETKQFEMMLAGQPGPAGPGPQAAQMPGMGMPGMPGMPDMPPEMMNAMFATMNAQGLNDPSQMDFGSFMQQMQSMGGMPGQSGPTGPAGQGGYGGQAMQQQASNQNYGAQQHAQSYNHQQQGAQGYGGGTPQPQSQGQPPGFEGYSTQQLALMQAGNGPPQGPAGGGRGRGRGRGRHW